MSDKEVMVNGEETCEIRESENNSETHTFKTTTSEWGCADSIDIKIEETEYEEPFVSSDDGDLAGDELRKLIKEFLTVPLCVVDLDVSARDCGRNACMNPLCDSTEECILAPSFTKSVYGIPDEENLLLCMECLDKASNFFSNLETLIKRKGPIRDWQLLNTAEVIIVDDDEDQNGKVRKNKTPQDEDYISVIPEVEQSVEELDSKYDIKRYAREIKKKLEEDIELLTVKYKENEANMAGASNLLYSSMQDLYIAYGPEKKELAPVEVPYEEMRPQMLKKMGLEENDCLVTGHLPMPRGPPNLPPFGTLEFPKPKVGDRMYAMKTSVFSEWVPSLVDQVIQLTSENGSQSFQYRVVINSNTPSASYKKDVTAQLMAYFDPPKVMVPVGTRIIAEYSNPSQEEARSKFFSGIVAEIPNYLNNFRYLVFFDDGKDLYVSYTGIRIVCEAKTNVWEHFKPKFQQFIKRYTTTYPERAMLKVKNLDSVKTEYKGLWANARVIDVDCSLVKLMFLHDKHTEWIYRGSHRLYPVVQGFSYRRLAGRPRIIAARRTGGSSGPLVTYELASDDEDDKSETSSTSSQPSRAVARKSSTRLPDFVEIEQTRRLYDRRAARIPSIRQQDEGVVETRIPPNKLNPKPYVPHTCDSKCTSWAEVKEEDTKGVNPLVAPVLYGFARQTDVHTNTVSYIAPCGKKLRSIDDVLKYLNDTELKLGIDLFHFDPWINIYNEYVVPEARILLPDLSFGVESVPITVINTVNTIVPTYMDYMTHRRASDGVNLNLDPEFLVGCDCTDNCQDKTKCACWQLTMSEGNVTTISKRSDFHLETVGYQYKRLPNLVATGIYECNSRCKCCTKTCLNRVVQQPLKHKLQLFMTPNKGWGTRCLNDIPAGTFICVYVGNIFTEAVANEDGRLYGDEYFAELDYIEVVEANKEGYEDYIDPDEYLKEDQNNTSEKRTEEEEDENFCVSPTSDIMSNTSTYRMNLRKRNNKKKKSSKEGSDSEIEDNPDTQDSCSSGEGPASRAIADIENINESQMPKRPSVRSYFGEDECVYIMDAKSAGNIGRYLNHSCDPNIFVQNVFVDTHDLRFPWVSFFSLKYIPAGTELTWDYRYEVGSVPGKKLKCYCASENCRGRLL